MPDLPQTAAFRIACADHPSEPARRNTLHLSFLPRTTKWYRVRGRPTRRENAIKQQYLSAREEKTLVKFVLHMSNSNYPVPLKFLRSLAREIRRQRAVTSQASPIEDQTALPGKNWPQGFFKRNPELKARKRKAIAWNRHDVNIYDKVSEWFSLIGKELQHPTILQENVYNMDKTGVLLSILGSLKVLVASDDLRSYRGTGVQRSLITAMECISGDGRYLDPLVIWPATTHRSTWTTYPTPGWHFACTKTGYTDAEVHLYWMQHVFDPSTRERANGRPRMLISDGFGTHESLEVMTYCFDNNIILCRLPSHTSHKLQPCDIGVFGPLKTAYREQVERLFRGGANTIGKQHFTLLYSRAREAALNARNVRSGWSKAGLYPFHPGKVLDGMSRPAAVRKASPNEATSGSGLCLAGHQLCTPTTSVSFNVLRSQVEKDLSGLDDETRLRIQKLANAGADVFAERALLRDRERTLLEQNNEKKARQSVRSTVVGKAKVMSYEDIVEARERRNRKEADKAGGRRRRSKKKPSANADVHMQRLQDEASLAGSN